MTTALTYLLKTSGRAASIARRHVLAVGICAAVATVSAGAGIGYALTASPAPAATPVSAAFAAQSSAGAPTAAARHRLHRAPILRTLMAETARETGMTRQAVVAALRSGKSLNDIAGSHSAAVQQAVLAKIKTRLDKAVSAHKITAAQETKLLSNATARIQKLMSAPGTDLRPHAHRRAGPRTGSAASTSTAAI